jgi:alcohol dehydrogenase class IV
MGTKKDAKAAVDHVFALNESIGIPSHLRSVGMDEGLIPSMAKDAMLSGNILVNPRTTTQQDIEALYTAAL